MLRRSRSGMILVSTALLLMSAGCGQIGRLTYIDLTESTPRVGWSDTSSISQEDAEQQLKLLQEKLKMLDLKFKATKTDYESSCAKLEKSIETMTDELAKYKTRLEEQQALLSDRSRFPYGDEDARYQQVQQSVVALRETVEQLTDNLNATTVQKEKNEQEYLAEKEAYDKERMQLETLIVVFSRK